MKYRVKETFEYEPSGRVDSQTPTIFKKGEIVEFETYKGKCCKEGEMILAQPIEPKCNNGWVWRADYFNEHFEKA